MARKPFIPSKSLVLVLALVAIGSAVWLVPRGPREPVFKGKTLSWWFTDGRMQSANPYSSPLTREHLQSLGPDAVAWLGYKAAQTSVWDPNGDKDEISSWESLTRGLRRRWEQVGWLNDRYSDFDSVRLESIQALATLGPEASPAIPSLLQAMQCRDTDTRRMAAEAVMATGVAPGAAGWPGVGDVIQHSPDLPVRLQLLQKFSERWQQDPPPSSSPTQFVLTIEFLLRLTLDADEQVRSYAEHGLRNCASGWSRQPHCAEGVHLMLDHLAGLDPEQRRIAFGLLATGEYRPYADALIPRLTALAASEDALTCVRILHVLVELDPGNPTWPAQFDTLAASSNPVIADAAVKVLEITDNAHRGGSPKTSPMGTSNGPAFDVSER